MTSEEQLVLIVRGHIASQSEEDQKLVKSCADEIRKVLDSGGSHAVLALALVSAEVQVTP
jgi:hypothetical protein